MRVIERFLEIQMENFNKYCNSTLKYNYDNKITWIIIEAIIILLNKNIIILLLVLVLLLLFVLLLFVLKLFLDYYWNIISK